VHPLHEVEEDHRVHRAGPRRADRRGQVLRVDGEHHVAAEPRLAREQEIRLRVPAVIGEVVICAEEDQRVRGARDHGVSLGAFVDREAVRGAEESEAPRGEARGGRVVMREIAAVDHAARIRAR